ncbi:hypothetical protein LTR86_011221 [Recurvomyces mirabilis]|nr:hypothetical protein LTR86_011221 [Recurvomyces mirabilis]
MSSSRKFRVAVVGLGGTLSDSVIKHLLSAGLIVTALTRDPERYKQSFREPIKVIKASYDSIEALVPILEGQHAVVDLLARDQWPISIRLIDAAIAAKVPHFIPSSFGIDMRLAAARNMPSLSGKAKLEDHITAKGKEGAITYTIIQTSMIFEWALSRSVFLPLEGGTAFFFDNGDVRVSASLIDDIGKAVASVLLVGPGSDAALNRVLLMHSTVFSLAQILEYARIANPEKHWEVETLQTAAIWKRSWEAYGNGDRSPETMRGFLVAGSFGDGLARFDNVDNDILGIQMMSDDALKDAVAKYVV